jgi:hypothetical protein
MNNTSTYDTVTVNATIINIGSATRFDPYRVNLRFCDLHIFIIA